ncbi:MAG: N-acetylmuramoyl-L-alanine amidase [Pseudomonadota bacterium]
MRHIDEIIIHCSATKANMDIGAAQIRDWHVKDNGWSDIGYHYIIRRNGILEVGRPVHRIGAHCKGHNVNTLGVCLVGGIDENGKPENNFTVKQMERFDVLLRRLKREHSSIAKITGHNEYANKACPCFDVKTFLARM